MKLNHDAAKQHGQTEHSGTKAADATAGDTADDAIAI